MFAKQDPYKSARRGNTELCIKKLRQINQNWNNNKRSTIKLTIFADKNRNPNNYQICQKSNCNANGFLNNSLGNSCRKQTQQLQKQTQQTNVNQNTNEKANEDDDDTDVNEFSKYREICYQLYTI